MTCIFLDNDWCCTRCVAAKDKNKIVLSVPIHCLAPTADDLNGKPICNATTNEMVRECCEEGAQSLTYPLKRR